MQRLLKNPLNTVKRVAKCEGAESISDRVAKDLSEAVTRKTAGTGENPARQHKPLM